MRFHDTVIRASVCVCRRQLISFQERSNLANAWRSHFMVRSRGSFSSVLIDPVPEASFEQILLTLLLEVLCSAMFCVIFLLDPDQSVRGWKLFRSPESGVTYGRSCVRGPLSEDALPCRFQSFCSFWSDSGTLIVKPTSLETLRTPALS